MKINIWVHKEDIINNDINKHYYQCPQPGWQNYVQVEVTQDEFVKLEDKNTKYTSSIDGPGIKMETGRSLENYTYPEFVKDHYE